MKSPRFAVAAPQQHLPHELSADNTIMLRGIASCGLALALAFVVAAPVAAAAAAAAVGVGNAPTSTTGAAWAARLGEAADWEDGPGQPACKRELPRRQGTWLVPEKREHFPSLTKSALACSGFAYGHVAMYAATRDARPVDDRICSAARVLDEIWERWRNVFSAEPRAPVLGANFTIHRVDRMELFVTDPIGRLSPTLPSAGALYFVWAAVQGRHSMDEERFILLHRDGKSYLHGRLTRLQKPPKSLTVPCSSVEDESSQLRVLSYNVWNTMPHQGSMWNQTARDARYGRRLAMLVDTIIKADADIVILQEVRFDTTFGIAHGPCQLEHLLQKLAYPYFVHQPAMGFVGNGFSYEGDEGVSILSRYPIIDSSYKLLSRQVQNEHDFHQRVCLHARVAIPNVGAIDTFTSHFSLNPASRLKGSREVMDFADEKRDENGNGMPIAQIFAGDVNDEPGSPALEPLQGRGFRDVWLEYHGESAEPRQGSLNPNDLDQAFTFPSDEPKKRIDFMLARGSRLRTERVELIGQHAILDPDAPLHFDSKVSKKKGQRNTVGMEHPASRIWASDHRGVLAHFSVRTMEGCCAVPELARLAETA